MYKLFVIASTCLVLTIAMPYEPIEIEGQEYYLVPVSRERREVKWDVMSPGIGYIENRETLFNDNKQKVDAAVFAQKNFATHSDPTAGGKIDYKHIDSGSTLSVIAQQTRNQGKDLGLEGRWNIVQKGNAGVDLVGNYQRHYGGPGGTRDPAFGAMLQGHVDF